MSLLYDELKQPAQQYMLLWVHNTVLQIAPCQLSNMSAEQHAPISGDKY